MSTGTQTSPQRILARGVFIAIAACLLLIRAFGFPDPAAARFDSDPYFEDTSTGGIVFVPPAFQKPAEGFDWFAQNRYRKWVENWAERGKLRPWLSETYNPEYVNPSEWTLFMQGCQEEEDFMHVYFPDDFPKSGRLYRWKWNGKTKSYSSDCATPLTFPAQGTYLVELTVKEKGGATKTWTRSVQVKDYLIVVLGDSSASGEGAPDRPVKQFQSSNSRADWVDDRCHRSEYAGGAQAAKIIEDADPHTSVTFLSFACSGATLHTMKTSDNVPHGTGITGPYVGVEPPRLEDDSLAPMLPAQTEQLFNALTRFGQREARPIDALIVAGGINDIEFATLVADCILQPTCYLIQHLDMLTYIPRVAPGWAKLKQQLDSYGIVAKKRLALEYPGFFHDDNGNMCPWLLDDIIPLPGFLWTLDEIAFAHEFWEPMLNDAVYEGATNNGFTYVGGINDDFFYHGMCAKDRYINTATDAVNTQGDDEGEFSQVLGQMTSTGTAHPNWKGYQAYAFRILEHLTHLIYNDPPVPGFEQMWVSPPFPKSASINVLHNDTDPDGDELIIRIATLPDHGKLDFTTDGWVTYTPKNGYKGTDRFIYTVSDGKHERFQLVPITVEPIVAVQAKVEFGATATIEGLAAHTEMGGPYEVRFDFEIPTDWGIIRPIPGQAAVTFAAPDKPRKRHLILRYTVHSITEDRNSPDYGRSVPGVLKIRLMRRVR